MPNRDSSRIILNQRELPEAPAEQSIDIALTLAMADLKAQYIDLENGAIRYQAIRGSEPFERYRGLTGHLRSFGLPSLQSRDQRLAFWINIYNAAVIDGVIELGLRRSVKEFPGFFNRIAYNIGGYPFSLNEVEHGILRANRRPPYRLFRPFRRGDPRLEFAVRPIDPRIHFTLVCGARSCPAIAFYEAEQVQFQLQLAATSFINSPHVKILPRERTLLISMIFKWYRSDFEEGYGSLFDTLLVFLDEGEKKEFLEKNRDRIRIKYQPYDWNLNEETRFA